MIFKQPLNAWLNAKTRKNNWPNKNRSSHKPENEAAFIENASRMFAKQVELAMTPTGETNA